MTSEDLRGREVLLGLNGDEGTYFLIYAVPGFDLSDSLITKKQFLYGIDLLFHVDSDVQNVIASEYVDSSSLDDPAVYRDALDRAATDASFNCPVQAFAER